jgi:hypothetical protein
MSAHLLPNTYYLSCYLLPVPTTCLKRGKGATGKRNWKQVSPKGFQSFQSFGLGLKQKPGNLPVCSICGPGTGEGWRFRSSLVRGFQKQAARRHASNLSLHAQGARQSVATSSVFALVKPAGLPSCVKAANRWGFVCSSRVPPFIAARS